MWSLYKIWYKVNWAQVMWDYVIEVIWWFIEWDKEVEARKVTWISLPIPCSYFSWSLARLVYYKIKTLIDLL